MDDVPSHSLRLNKQVPSANVPAVRPRRRSAINAVKHGLASRTLLPEILGPGLLERYRERFISEWRPLTPTESHLVEELARHAAALARAEQIEEGLFRTSARALSQTASQTGLGGRDSEAADRILAAAIGADTLDQLTRHRRAHERAFLATQERLSKLRKAQGATESLVQPKVPPAPRPVTEEACRAYLRRRWEAGAARCPSCQGADGILLCNRQLWQCKTCRHQTGLRAGTVMARSSLPLHVWFGAIAAIAVERDISVEQLSEITKVVRKKTVATIARRIREAIDSPDAERLLAGLTAQAVSQLSSPVAEPSAPAAENLQNEIAK